MLFECFTINLTCFTWSKRDRLIGPNFELRKHIKNIQIFECDNFIYFAKLYMQRKAKTPLPPGCTKVIVDNDPTKVHYRCPVVGWSVHMELRRCSFNERRARLAEHIKKGKHIFNIPREKDEDFPPILKIGEKILSDEQLQHSIMRAVGIISASLNISANKTVDGKMEEFIHFLINLGIKLRTQFPQRYLDVNELFQMPSINQVTAYIRIAGDEAKSNAVQIYNSKFVSLEMDSGTVKKLKNIHYVISVPGESFNKPFLYALIENENFDYLRYSIATVSVLKELFDKNIYVSAIIVDNLKSQTNGLEFMKETSENPLIKNIYIVHCFCHLISLVFVNVLEHNSHLGKLVNSIKALVSILRKSSSKTFIGKLCPTIVETRWLYLYEILTFFAQFENDIKTILISINEDEILSQLPEILELINIIKPLRYFCDAMESNYSICSVGQYIQEIIANFRKQKFLYIEDIFKDIFVNFIARIKSNNFDLVICSYFLSPSGRNYFRNRYKNSVSFFIPNEKFFSYPSLFEKDSYQKNTQIIDDISYQLFLENTLNNSESQEISLLNSEPATSQNDGEVSKLFVSYREYYNSLKKEKFEDIINIDLFSDMRDITERVLTNLSENLGIRDINIHDLLYKWVFEETDKLPFKLDIFNDDPVRLWRSICTYEEWEKFANLILRIVSIGTSESNCERFISKQRYVTGDHGTHYGVKTMEARLRVISNSDLIDI